jgi:pyruvate/2-oxoglutarate dehydrogenase complex dihydrolipoamide acyltransferase (E2) component
VDATLAAVMTDKATVEIPSPVDGEIIWLGAEIGDKVAVGSDLVRLSIPGERDAASAAQPLLRSVAAEAAKPVPAAKPRAANSEGRSTTSVMSATPAARPAQPTEPRPTLRATARAGTVGPVASPAVRLRARGGHRPASSTGHWAGRSHHARRPRRIRRPRSWRGAIAGVSAEERGRRCQSDRAAAQDR